MQVVEVDEPALAAFLAGAQEVGRRRRRTDATPSRPAGRVALAAIAPEQLARARPRSRRRAHDFKAEAGELAAYGVEPAFDAALAAYLLDPGRADYRVDDLLEEQALELTVGATRPIATRSAPPPPARAAALGRSRSGSSTARWTTLSRRIELPLVAGALLDGARRHRGRHGADGRDRRQGLRALRGARRPGARAGGLRVRARQPQAARRGAVRAARPSGRPQGQDGLLDRPARAPRIRELHPIVPVIEEWRELSKLLSTYLSRSPS